MSQWPQLYHGAARAANGRWVAHGRSRSFQYLLFSSFLIILIGRLTASLVRFSEDGSTITDALAPLATQAAQVELESSNAGGSKKGGKTSSKKNSSSSSRSSSSVDDDGSIDEAAAGAGPSVGGEPQPALSITIDDSGNLVVDGSYFIRRRPKGLSLVCKAAREAFSLHLRVDRSPVVSQRGGVIASSSFRFLYLATPVDLPVSGILPQKSASSSSGSALLDEEEENGEENDVGAGPYDDEAPTGDSNEAQ
jgi:hypothetical protein